MIPIWIYPIAALAAYAGFVSYLYKDAVNECAKFRANVEQAQEQSRLDSERREIEYRDISQQSSDAWAAALAYSRSHPVVRVLPRPDCNKGTSTSVSVTGLKPTQETAQFGLGREVVIAVEECQQRLENAAVDAAQVITLIEWIRKTHEASK
jgi:hypothetical protein